MPSHPANLVAVAALETRKSTHRLFNSILSPLPLLLPDGNLSFTPAPPALVCWAE
jgi:hypothetical protein